MWDKNLSGIVELWRLLLINSSHNASHLAKDEIIKILISSGSSAVTMSFFIDLSGRYSYVLVRKLCIRDSVNCRFSKSIYVMKFSKHLVTSIMY